MTSELTPATVAITTPEDLHAALRTAAELEHGLMCLYLFAAFTVQRDDPDPLRRHHILALERELLTIAHEEMRHLAYVWELQRNLGQPPHAQLPQFDVVERTIGGIQWRWDLRLGPIDKPMCDRLLRFESPHDAGDATDNVCGLHLAIAAALDTMTADGVLPYDGQTPAFTGSWSRFVGTALLSDPQEASKALRTLVADADATSPGSHAHRVRAIAAMLDALPEASRHAVPVRGDKAGTTTEQIAALCDDAHSLILASMLAIPQASEAQREPQRYIARRVMSGILRPLIEVLTALPPVGGHSAGPAFAVTVPEEPTLATVISNLDDLAARCRTLAGTSPRLAEVAITCDHWQQRLREAQQE